jgi:Holliday junction DNA helicase RuvB
MPGRPDDGKRDDGKRDEGKKGPTSRRAVSPDRCFADDEVFDRSLRPRRIEEFIGQDRSRENLALYIEAAKRRGEALDHVLLSGAPGLGKTTLAGIMANELAVSMHQTSGPALDRPGDLVGLLTDLDERDVLFIDEIHRVPAQVAEYLHAAMEDYAVDVVIDRGPGARSLRMPLKHFTLVGATTREGLLSGPFRARFGIQEKLEFYPPEDLARIVKRSASILDMEVDERAADEIAKRARGTPRIANRFLRRVRDVAEVSGSKQVTLDVANEGLRRLGVDEVGLDAMDRKILDTLHRHAGTAVGLKTIAVSVGEEQDTIEEVYEPFLIQQGFLLKSPKGRLLGRRAYEHMGYGDYPCAPDASDGQERLF